MKFLRYLTEATVLKTLKGSRIARSKYGVGKDIGGSLYLHKNYVNVIPKDQFERAEAVLFDQYPGFDYNTVRWDYKKGSIAFYNSPDFDRSHEPIAGEYIVVSPKGETVRKNEKRIWHHKWQWVKDDYRGFDVNKAIERSREWLSVPDIDFSRIGNAPFWDDFLRKNNLRGRMEV